jgi:hypothetical protein
MPAHATPEEILTAFEGLPRDDLVRLTALARALIVKTARSRYQEEVDLIHEALHRALDGRRKWPPAVHFMAFMTRTMESVINHDTDNMDNKPGAHTSFEVADFDAFSFVTGVYAPSAEERAAASEQRRQRVKALEAAERALISEGDLLAVEVLRGIAQELSQDELMFKTKANPRQLAAARKRVQRRLWAAMGSPRAMH